jgi:hypothetical protein
MMCNKRKTGKQEVNVSIQLVCDRRRVWWIVFNEVENKCVFGQAKKEGNLTTTLCQSFRRCLFVGFAGVGVYVGAATFGHC